MKYKAFVLVITTFFCTPALNAAPPSDACMHARTLRAGAVSPCTGLLVPSSDIRSLMIEVEELNARVIELQGELEVAKIQKDRDAVDLQACEDKTVVIRNTLHACEATKAPAPLSCPQSFGGWPWIALTAGVVVGGVGGWGVGRATCP